MIFYCARLSVCVYKNSLCNVWFFADFFYSLRATWNVASAARLLVCVRMLAQKTRRAFVNCQRFENEFIRETRVLLFLFELLLEHFSRSDIIRGEWIRNFDKSFSNGTIVWERAIVYFVHYFVLLIEVLYRVICIWNKTKLQNRSVNVARLVQRNE